MARLPVDGFCYRPWDCCMTWATRVPPQGDDRCPVGLAQSRRWGRSRHASLQRRSLVIGCFTGRVIGSLVRSDDCGARL